MKRLILSLSLLCMFASGIAWSADRIARVDEPAAAPIPSLEGISPAAAADVWLRATRPSWVSITACPRSRKRSTGSIACQVSAAT